MEFPTISEYYVIYWSGQISDTRLLLDTKKDDWEIDSVRFHSAMVFNKSRTKFYCCSEEENYQVSKRKSSTFGFNFIYL